MRTRAFFGILLIIGIVLAITIMTGRSRTINDSAQGEWSAQRSSTSHQHAAPSDRVPAYQEDEQSLSSLSPTLLPQRFSGETKKAYKVAQEIPRTLAQLPCYCYCDTAMGHKSLHSCFVSEHAANCDRCTEEALLAYRLQKKQKLTPRQIRERIIAMYSGK